MLLANSRERDATLVRHCLAQDSEKRKKNIETSGEEERNIPWVAVETEISLPNLIVKLRSISTFFEQCL
jgi:hypothetical protein